MPCTPAIPATSDHTPQHAGATPPSFVSRIRGLPLPSPLARGRFASVLCLAAVCMCVSLVIPITCPNTRITAVHKNKPLVTTPHTFPRTQHEREFKIAIRVHARAYIHIRIHTYTYNSLG